MKPPSTARGLLAAVLLVAAAAAILVATRTTLAASGQHRLVFGMWRTRHVLAAAGLTWLGALVAVRALSVGAFERALCASLGVGLALVGLEATGRAVLVDWAGVFRPESTSKLSFQAVPHLDESGETTPDLALAWGLPVAPIAYRFRTDSHGFRNAIDRESATLYLVGDSYLVAGLLPFEETVTARVEAALRRPTMAVALSGLGPEEEIAVFEGAELDVEGALVVQFFFEGNDLSDSARWSVGITRTSPPARSGFLNSLIVSVQEATQPVEPFVDLRSGRLNGVQYAFRWVGADVFPHLDRLEPVLGALSAFRTRVESRGGRYAVVFLPSKLRVLGPLCEFTEGALYADVATQLSDLPQRLAEWARSEDIPLLDLTPALIASTRAGEVPWFQYDTHWNEIGHRVAARELVEWSAMEAWSAEAAK